MPLNSLHNSSVRVAARRFRHRGSSSCSKSDLLGVNAPHGRNVKGERSMARRVPRIRRLRAHRIHLHRRAAIRLRRTARRRHIRAAATARRALLAHRVGRRLRARRLLKRALRLKASAARAGLRARMHGMRIRTRRVRRIPRPRVRRRAV